MSPATFGTVAVVVYVALAFALILTLRGGSRHV